MRHRGDVLACHSVNHEKEKLSLSGVAVLGALH
jgi:hypothetical protein